MKKILFSLLFLLSIVLFSQQPATSVEDVEKGLQQKLSLTQNSRVKNLPFTNIGPSIMSGRVVGFAVNTKNPIEFYVGYASGGVWYTKNNGTSFTPILDSSPTQNVGCLAVDWNTNTIYVGTGEVNASRSSYAGIGLLKSNDNGTSWENIGLKDSHHISSILLNPNNPNEIVVGVLGHLYSQNEERGVYKTMDGGKTWNRTLFINGQTGIIEVVHDPNNFGLMYASSWDKDRKAWNFKGNGEGSGIYKSNDAGNTWIKVSVEGSGFPTGEGIGRIGLAIYDAHTVYAIHDNQNRREAVDKADMEGDVLSKEQFKSMTSTQLLDLDDEKLNQYLRDNRFPEKYTAESVKKSVRSQTVQPVDLAKYLEDANSLLFDTPVIGAEVYKSSDGGKSWVKTHDDFLDGLYNSYGYYFGKIHVDPSNKDGIYIYGVPILKSKDGGKSFTSIDADNVHADHHALWINPNGSGHLINGNDGGINISYDDGVAWIKNNAPPVGQFYAINVDHETPYNVYGGLQDNGVWVGSHEYEAGPYWQQSGHYPYEAILGGDGMQVQIDSRNNDIIYTGFQFGNYYRLNRATDETSYIQPKHELGDNPYRFNWQTPILLSPHNQDIVYLGGNKLMRSMNQGTDWEAISGDLTQGGKLGNVAYGTLTSISESSFQFGLIYTGSDDGIVHVTRNSGGNWINVSTTFPKDLWVSRVVASSHKKERVYVTLNGYRWDDFKPYVFMSDNYGATWININGNLPISPVNVIREDPVNEDVLYLGTDNGAYVSFDRGESWDAFSSGLPNVAVHDLVVQEQAKDLVLGTHGRSIYVADISLIQKLNNSSKNELLIAEIDPIRSSRSWGSSYSLWRDPFEPSITLQFYSPENGEVKVSVETEQGEVVNQFSVEAVKGINMTEYDVTFSEKGIKTREKRGDDIKKAQNGKAYLSKGVYTIRIENKSKDVSTTFIIK